MYKTTVEEPVSTWLMFMLAMLVGVFGGLGSIAFSAFIGFVHNLFFYGRISIDYDYQVHMAPSPWGWAIILVPVAGGLLVNFITSKVSPEARGHGVPEVMNAIHYKEGRIRPVVVGAKAIASALSIGTGGSVGREGPIIQIGSAFGSVLGQWITMPARQRVVLVAAGAAAGIAGTFNAPLGGLAFAIELMLVSISARAVALCAVASVIATYIARFYSGLHPSFDVPALEAFGDHLTAINVLFFCLPLGLLIGVAATVFLKSIYWFEDRFTDLFKNTYQRHVIGMALVGVLLFAMQQLTGEYYVGGVGYATVLDILRHSLSNPGFLFLLFLAKLLATGLTLGSGASGGIFSPSLFLGASLGAAFGQFVNFIYPGAGIDPSVFAIAGMAAMVSGTTGALVTAILMIFEQTRDYGAVLPIIITASLAHVVREHFTSESIYTLKLARRGLWLPKGMQANTAASRQASTIMSRDFQVVEKSDLANWITTHRPGQGANHTLFANEGTVCGVAGEELRYLLRDQDLEQVAQTNIFFVTGDTRLPVLLRGMRAKVTQYAVVMRTRRTDSIDDVIGVISNREIFSAIQDGVELME